MQLFGTVKPFEVIRQIDDVLQPPQERRRLRKLVQLWLRHCDNSRLDDGSRLVWYTNN